MSAKPLGMVQSYHILAHSLLCFNIIFDGPHVLHIRSRHSGEGIFSYWQIVTFETSRFEIKTILANCALFCEANVLMTPLSVQHYNIDDINVSTCLSLKQS